MRLHPLTWCIAATTAGTLLGINLWRCSFDGSRIVYGWPLTHEWVTQHITFDRVHIRLNGNGESEVINTKGETIEESEWSYLAMGANIALGALIVVCALILCECLVFPPQPHRGAVEEASHRGAV